jgi:YnbE-like lipoprotein
MKQAALLIVLASTGCINIKAPDKPIEINLNVNIKQEVIVKLQKDADDFITSNPELFPK